MDGTPEEVGRGLSRSPGPDLTFRDRPVDRTRPHQHTPVPAELSFLRTLLHSARVLACTLSMPVLTVLYALVVAPSSGHRLSPPEAPALGGVLRIEQELERDEPSASRRRPMQLRPGRYSFGPPVTHAHFGWPSKPVRFRFCFPLPPPTMAVSPTVMWRSSAGPTAHRSAPKSAVSSLVSA